jgi:hypothetical protein
MSLLQKFQVFGDEPITNQVESLFELKDRMKLLEILNTEPDIKWTQIGGYKNKGSFQLDGKKFEIQLDEYEVLNKTLVDFGFTTNDDIHAVNSGKNSARILGSIVNGSIKKIKEINPDAILVSVLKSSGLVESRKSVYESILKWTSKRTGFSNFTGWIENNNLYVQIISKEKLSKEEIEIFKNQVKLKN